MTYSPQLVMEEGPEPGQTFVLDQDLLTVGRDPGNDIVIGDPQVSRHHARIRRQGSLMVIEDVGSTNGTYINGMLLTNPHTLTPGDVVSLGDAITLTYHEMAVATTEPLAGRPTISPARPSHEPQPKPPEYSAAPPLAAKPAEEPRRNTWLWVGCGCVVLLVVIAVVGVFLLDYLRLLPPVFYEPLRWLGLI